MPMFMSLGESCQVAHQIHRATGQSPALLFDWLITRIDSVGALLSEDGDWFRPGYWEITDDELRVRDKGTGLEFQHEFEVMGPDDRRVDVSKVEAHLDAARSKYLYLKRRTLEVLSGASDLYVVRLEWWADAAVAEASAAAIFGAYGRLNPGLKVVVAAEAGDTEAVSDRHLLLKVRAGEDWTGDDRSWDRVFAMIGAWADSRAGA